MSIAHEETKAYCPMTDSWWGNLADTITEPWPSSHAPSGSGIDSVKIQSEHRAMMPSVQGWHGCSRRWGGHTGFFLSHLHHPRDYQDVLYIFICVSYELLSELWNCELLWNTRWHLMIPDWRDANAWANENWKLARNPPTTHEQSYSVSIVFAKLNLETYRKKKLTGRDEPWTTRQSLLTHNNTWEFVTGLHYILVTFNVTAIIY